MSSEQRIALVTGGSGGIGAAIVRRLAADGLRVLFTYHSGDEDAAKVETDTDRKAGAIQCELTEPGAPAALIRQCREDHGADGIDVLVNNAGIARLGEIENLDEADYDQVFALNVKAPLLLMKAAAPYMREGGRIVNVSSLVTQYPHAGAAVYGASKGALEIMTEVASREFAARGVTANTVRPGPTSPGMFDGVSEEQRKTVDAALNGIGSPEDVAEVIGFLASEASRWVTGEHIDAGGGWRGEMPG